MEFQTLQEEKSRQKFLVCVVVVEVRKRRRTQGTEVITIKLERSVGLTYTVSINSEGREYKECRVGSTFGSLMCKSCRELKQ